MSKRISWLTRAQQATLDTKLFNYKTIDKAISLRKLELETMKEHNFDIGRVQKSSIQNVPLELVIKFSEDLILQNLYMFRRTVEACYNQLSSELQLIFSKRWLENGRTWQDIAKELHFTNRNIYYKRSIILEKYAELSGEFRKAI